MRPLPALRSLLPIALIALSLPFLEAARIGVDIDRFYVGQTPVTAYAHPEATGPVVVVAHGFAGSQQMMQGYALPFARAGYRVFVFEFLGHGRNPVPMSGDLSSIEGATRLLVDQTSEVIDAVAPGDAPVALLGHSMATDILVRAAAPRSDIGPLVLVSAFSQVIDATTPDDLLLVSGAWEAGLRDYALEAVRMVDSDAAEGETVSAGAVSRRAVAAPFSEHVSVLHSRVGRRAALDWLDRSFGRTSAVTILPTGWAILGLLFGIVALFAPIASRLPEVPGRPVSAPLGGRHLALAILAPTLLTAVVAVPLAPRFLPVLVADYLVVHLFAFGAIQLALLRLWRVPIGPFAPRAFGVLLLWSILFGVALDRYAANFWPTADRLWIIAAMLVGTVPAMLADAVLTTGASLSRRVAIRAGFLLSLGIAVALDFESLFFLILIAPVLVLFYLVFGTMGRAAARRAGPLAPGLALGLVLAWSLGVSFPLFQP